MKYLTLCELNEYLHNRNLRKYQQLIACGVSFSLMLDGGTHRFFRCYVNGDENILIFVSDNIVGEAQYYSLTSRQAGTGYELINNIKILEITERTNDILSKSWHISRPVVVAGHWNFAHFMWNQFTALYFLLSHVPDLNISFIRTNFGDLKKYFPKIICIEERDISIYENSFLAGGQYLDSLRHKIILDSLTEVIPVYQRKCMRQFYLGVRGGGNRSLTNESEFFSELIRLTLKIYPDAIFFVDGFSYTSANSKISAFLERTASAEKVINTLVGDFGANTVKNINGKSLFDVIGFIKNIDYYITHEGTMQHKIGWLCLDIKGLIITKSKHPKAVAEWHSAQVEGAGVPDYISHHYYGFEDESRDSNFSITDITKSALDVLTLMVANLPVDAVTGG
jgi:hypothetical protein